MKNPKTSQIKNPLILFGIAVLALSTLMGGGASIHPIIPFIILILLIAAVFFIGIPDLASLIVTFIIFTNAAVIAYRFHNLPFFISAALPTLILGVLVIYKVFFLKMPIVLDMPILFFLLYIMIGILGAINSRDLLESYDNLFILISEGFLLYLLLINSIRSQGELRNVIWAILFASIFIGGVSAFQEATKTYDNNYWGFAQVPGRGFGIGETAFGDVIVQSRLGGPIGEKNYFAQIMLMVIPMSLFQFRAETARKWKFLALVAAGFATIATALTFSRGVAVAFAIIVLVMIIFRYISLNQFALLAVGIIMIMLIFPQYGTRILTLQDVFTIQSQGASGTDVSIQGRFGEMYTAWLVFVDHPYIGVGPNMFRNYYEEYADRAGVFTHNTTRRAHNQFIEIAANNGIFGLLLYLAMPGYILFHLTKINRFGREVNPQLANMAIGLFLAIISYLATGLFLSLAYERYYWMILAISGATIIISNQQNHITTEELKQISG